MEIIGLLASIAFVFDLTTLAQSGALKKEIRKLAEDLEQLKAVSAS